MRLESGLVAARLRLQWLALFIAAVVLPIGINSLGIAREPFTPAFLLNGIVGAAFAVTLGLFLLRRVTAFPGTRSFGFVLPSFAASYGLVGAAFLFLRLDYSRLYLISSFILALIASFLGSYWLTNVSRTRFYVVPHGDVGFTAQVPQADWITLERPEIPDRRGAAIVADLHFAHAPEWERMIAEAAIRGHPVYHTKQLRESLTGRMTIDHLSENSFGSLLPNMIYRRVKRAADVVLAFILICILIVPMVLIAVFVRMDSEGPALFTQERMGYRAKTFRILKFRTMRIVIPPEEATTAAASITQTDDPRITRVGRILRRTRLDELPQLFNVLRGEMSLIGPRPEALPLSLWYEAEIPFYRYRHIVRPGITGWAQVNQGHVADLESISHKLHYDFFYIRNFSAWLDLLISLRTIIVICSGAGAK